MKLANVAALVQLATDAASGIAPEPLTVMRLLVDLALDVVSVEELRRFLDAEAQRRADIAADLAEIGKFGGP